MLLLGLATMNRRDWVPVFGLVSGTVAAMACVLFLAGAYLRPGMGGMERLAFGTLTVWTSVLGGVFLRDAASRAQPCTMARSCKRFTRNSFVCLALRFSPGSRSLIFARIWSRVSQEWSMLAISCPIPMVPSGGVFISRSSRSPVTFVA